MFIIESLCSTAEIDTTLQINYTSLKKERMAEAIQITNVSKNTYYSMESKEREKDKGPEQTASESKKSLKGCAVYTQISILTSCGFSEQRDPVNL